MDSLAVAEVAKIMGEILKTIPVTESTGKTESSEIMIGIALTFYVIKLVKDWMKGDTLTEIKDLLKGIFKENGKIKDNQVELQNLTKNIDATTTRNHFKLGKIESHVGIISSETSHDAKFTNGLAEESRISFGQIKEKISDINVKLAAAK